MDRIRGKKANDVIYDDVQDEHVGCDEACPANVCGEIAIRYQNYGCLPEPYEITQMLTQKKVWMCHSNPEKPCVYTKLKEVPLYYEAITQY